MTADALFVGSAILLGTASGAMIIAAALYTAYCLLIPRFERREPLAVPRSVDSAETFGSPRG